MTVDLSSIKEIRSINGCAQVVTNELLASGEWVLLEVRVVEYQRWVPEQHGVDVAYLRKGDDTISVLGRIV